MLEIGICDDQPECVEMLQNLLDCYLKKKRLDAHVTVFGSTEELLSEDWQRFQILFLDVVMGKQDGVTAAKEIRRKNPDVSLLFVSAYLDYATMGYQVKASAYLLKSQLANIFDSAMDAVLLERKLNQDRMDITVDGCKVSMPLHRIMYIESQGRMAVFNCGCEYHTYMRFSDIEGLLAGKGFLRVHRCYIVNLAHCVTIKNYQAVLDNGKTLPCSRQEYRSLVQRLVRWKGINR